MSSGVGGGHKGNMTSTSGSLPVRGDGEVASVSLSDCLSCSGCITSSEEILLDMHHASLLRNKSLDPNTAVAVSLSPHACASIAAACNLTVDDAALKLSSFLREKVYVDYVLSTSVGSTLALQEACAEFEDRLVVVSHVCRVEHVSVIPTLGDCLPSSCRYLAHKAKGEGHRRLGPLLCSECPGFTVYMEKSHPQHMVRLLSRVRSPQVPTKSQRNVPPTFSPVTPPFSTFLPFFFLSFCPGRFA